MKREFKTDRSDSRVRSKREITKIRQITQREIRQRHQINFKERYQIYKSEIGHIN